MRTANILDRMIPSKTALDGIVPEGVILRGTVPNKMIRGRNAFIRDIKPPGADGTSSPRNPVEARSRRSRASSSCTRCCSPDSVLVVSATYNVRGDQRSGVADLAGGFLRCSTSRPSFSDTWQDSLVDAVDSRPDAGAARRCGGVASDLAVMAACAGDPEPPPTLSIGRRRLRPLLMLP